MDPHFPDKSVTARPPETRMGKGKGQPEFWVATVRPGNILFELDGVPESVARESLRLAADKLPVRTKFLSRHHVAARPETSMKIKEIIEMSTDELLTKKRDLRAGKFAPALAAAERTAGAAEPAAFAPTRRGPDRDACCRSGRRRRSNFMAERTNRECHRRITDSATSAARPSNRSAVRARRGWAR